MKQPTEPAENAQSNNNTEDVTKIEELVSEISTDSGNSFNFNTSEFPTPRNSVGVALSNQLSKTASNTPVLRKSLDSCSRNIRMRTPSVHSMFEMSTEEKTQIIRKNLTVMFSTIYAVFLVVIGSIIYLNHQTLNSRYISEVFSSCTALIGMSWLIFFHIDLFRYKQRVMKKVKQKAEQVERTSTYTLDLGAALESAFEDTAYRFLMGRHSGSFYLKAGLAAFCFGHIINEGLQLGQEIMNYTQNNTSNEHCGQISSIAIHCIRPVYSFYQLFIVFKYSNIVINKYKELARFALMHIIATCLCFWFSTIVQDAQEHYQHKLSHIPQKNNSVQFATQHETDTKNTSNCASKAMLSVNHLQAIPYLYPFTVEFNLLLAGVWFIVWHNIGKEHHKANPHHFRHKINTEHGIEEVIYQSNLVISADCHASNKGLFAGLLLLVTVIISIIVFFVAMTTDEYVYVGVSIHKIQETTMVTLSLMGVILAYIQLSKLDFNLHPITFLDDVLLFAPLPFFFIHAMLSITADIQIGSVSRIVTSVLITIQVIIQTPFISDGLRRCSNSQALRYKKPGREIITFLIVSNLTIWIINTFEAKYVESHYAQQAFYGEFMWMFLSHTTLPLMLFYRFHSSVCLADIWKSAYEKGE